MNYIRPIAELGSYDKVIGDASLHKLYRRYKTKIGDKKNKPAISRR